MESDLFFSVTNGGSGSSYCGPETNLKTLNTSLSSKAPTSLCHSQVRLLSLVRERGVKLNQSGSVLFLPSVVVTASEKNPFFCHLHFQEPRLSVTLNSRPIFAFCHSPCQRLSLNKRQSGSSEPSQVPSLGTLSKSPVLARILLSQFSQNLPPLISD